ncbi:LCP family protein [Actinoplanes sp. NBC_00393]|uniref:LCP family protein n=1 Tax=Actinoplanes sp. NBC_00393 TaxID=2975953 RepID=UPI002E1CA8B1
MTTIEEELRAAFERHETLTPATAPVRAEIDFAWGRAKRRRTWRRAAGAAAAVLFAGAAVPAVQAGRHGDRAAVAPAAMSGSLDVLLLGSDHRSGRAADNRRADTLMLLHLSADRRKAFMVSLPRDGAVQVDGHPGAKLSHTLHLGGPELTREVVEDLSGVEVDATVTVDFRALRAVTEAVGGVPVCVRQGIPAQGGRKEIKPGCQDIGADDVGPLLQGRYRLKSGPYDRDRNNRAFLRALAEKVISQGSELSRLQALLGAAKDGVDIDGDTLALLRVAAALDKPEVIGIGAPTFSTIDKRQMSEEIYPEVGPSLFAAIRDDRLAEWAAANPGYVDG